MRDKQFSVLTLLLSCFLVVAGPLAAQEITRGAIMVRVEDPTGAVIPNAEVTVVSSKQPATQGQTGARGTILFSSLVPAEDYRVTVKASGFKTGEVTGISVGVNERRSVLVALEPGEVVQTVEVVAAEAGIDFAETTTGDHISDTIYQTVPLQRGITSAFFLAPGVVDGGGTCDTGTQQNVGCPNPSIGGASGLDNLYLIDGVNVTNQGFGGLGVTSRVFGSLGSGTTTAFIKEVEVKTGAYEAQYGQALGGIVNVVTKTGGNEFHGAVFGYYSPNKLEARREQVNRQRTANFLGFETHGLMGVDFGAEAGGFIFKDHLFFFGSINPAITRFERRAPQVDDQFTFGPGDCDTSTNPVAPLAGCGNLGSIDVHSRTVNYAAKLTGQINPSHRIEFSSFGDFTVRSFGPQRSLQGILVDPVTGAESPTGVPGDFSRLDFSNLNVTIRYNGIITPKWLVNTHFSNNHNRFEEQDFANVYSFTDFTGPITRALGGLGFTENGFSDDKTWHIDNTNIFSTGPLGEHEFTLGFEFSTADWEGRKSRSGAPLPMISDPLFVRPEDVGRETFWQFNLFSCQQLTGTADCFGQAPPAFRGATDTLIAQQNRADVLGINFNTNNEYIAAYVQDNWRWNEHLTLKLGLRFEQEDVLGKETGNSYVFGPSWGPRIGVIFDPLGNRRTKVQFSFARFFDRIPNDLAQRVFNAETTYIFLSFWVEPNRVILPDQAHYIGGSVCPDGGAGFICDPGTGSATLPGAFLAGAPEGTIPVAGTDMAFSDEFSIGVTHEFDHGIVVGGRYIDRRLKRATEDSNAASIEQALAGVPIPFIMVNPSAGGDNFTNPQVISIGSGPCEPGTQGGPGAGQCFAAGAGLGIPDGLPDGLPDPIRNYQAVEITFDRRLRGNWQFHANWRISSLKGNYEGSFRNDNGQTDPSITSLFDFSDSPGALALYDPGPLPNDRTHVINAYGSYIINEGPVAGLNIGFGTRITSGKPITELLAHPLFANAGEIPCKAGNLNVNDLLGNPIFATQCESDGRGAFGRTATLGAVDLHADYPFRVSERFVVRAGIDLFNVFNNQREITVREFKESTFGVLDPDFNTPSRLKRPYNTRFVVRVEW